MNDIQMNNEKSTIQWTTNNEQWRMNEVQWIINNEQWTMNEEP